MYYETSALLSSTRSRIYDRGKIELVKVIIFNKPAMDSNTFLLNPVKPEISHGQARKDQVVSAYVQSIIPLIMAHKEPKKSIKPVFLISQFRK